MTEWKKILVMSVLGVALSSVAQVNMRPEVAKPLQFAQEALQAKQPDVALQRIQEARAVGQLTEPERMLLERLVVVAAMGTQKFDLASSSLDYLLSNKNLTDSDRLTLTETAVSVRQRTKDYSGVIEWARKYLQMGGKNPRIRLALVQSLSIQGLHKDVVAEISEIQKVDAESGRLPDEAELRLYAFSQLQVKDEAGYVKTLTQLVKRYPSKAYWEDLLNRLPRLTGFTSRNHLDVFRLLEENGSLVDAEDFAEAAQVAMKSGFPHEALRFLDKVAQPPASGNLRKQAQKAISEDEKVMQSVKLNSENVNMLVQLGDVQVSRQQWTDAVAAYQKALSKGNVRREGEVRLHCGIALIKAGKFEAATEMMSSIKGDEMASLLGSLWILKAK
jgi:predicted Zn-dependent protease